MLKQNYFRLVMYCFSASEMNARVISVLLHPSLCMEYHNPLSAHQKTTKKVVELFFPLFYVKKESMHNEVYT